MLCKKKRSVLILITIIALILSSSLTSFGATKTKKMTVYDEVIKSGKYAYCCDGYRIYRVNLKTKKVLNLVKRTGAPDEGYSSMKKKGCYIYCLYYMQGEDSDIFRLYTKKKNPKKLNKKMICVDGYYLSKNRLYYSGIDMSTELFINRVMKLDGKSDGKSNIVCKVKREKSNVKGYRVIVKDNKRGNVSSWLKLPNGNKIKLGKYKYPTYYDLI